MAGGNLCSKYVDLFRDLFGEDEIECFLFCGYQ
jgi:hypothetical protein